MTTPLTMINVDGSRLITAEQAPNGHYVLCHFIEALKKDATLIHGGDYYRISHIVATGDYDSTADYIEDKHPWALLAFLRLTATN